MKVRTEWHGQRAFTAVGDSGYEINMDATEAYGAEVIQGKGHRQGGRSQRDLYLVSSQREASRCSLPGG